MRERETVIEGERKRKTFIYTFTLRALQAWNSKKKKKKSKQSKIVAIQIKESCLNPPLVPKTLKAPKALKDI